MACSCGQCDGSGPFTGGLCVWRTADKSIDVLWFRCDGPVRMTATAVRLYDDLVTRTITDVVTEPDAGRINILLHAEDWVPFGEHCCFEVLAADEQSVRSLLVQSTLTITDSEATLPPPALSGSMQHLHAFYAGAQAEPAKPEPPRQLVGAGATTKRNGGNGGNGNGGHAPL